MFVLLMTSVLAWSVSGALCQSYHWSNGWQPGKRSSSPGAPAPERQRSLILANILLHQAHDLHEPRQASEKDQFPRQQTEELEGQNIRSSLETLISKNIVDFALQNTVSNQQLLRGIIGGQTELSNHYDELTELNNRYDELTELRNRYDEQTEISD